MFHSQEASPYGFPHLQARIRMKQLWLLVWFESNKILEHDYSFTNDYIRSLNGIFNGTLTYRNDSFVKNNFYGNNCRYIKTRNAQVTSKEWKEYSKAVMSKPRY